MRNVPITLAKKLGEITADYRWFAIVYIVASFFLIPLFIFSISLAGWYLKKFRLDKLNNHLYLIYLGMSSSVYLVRWY
jgi:hypothetical protein